MTFCFIIIIVPESEEIKLSGEFVLKKAKKNPPDEKIAQEIPSSETEEAMQGAKKNKANFYSSLCLYPKNVKFENQEKDEEVILLVRRVLITNVPWIFTALVLIFIPPLIFIFSDLFTPFISVSPITILVLTLFFYLTVLGFIFVEFTLWYFNVGLITNKRIVDLDLHGILYKHVSETKLSLIEDVSYSKVGSIRAIFDYGDVFIQTAGTLINFEFIRVPQPARIVRIISDMIGGK